MTSRLLVVPVLALLAATGARTALASGSPPSEPPIPVRPPKTIPTTTLADLTLPAPDSTTEAAATSATTEPTATTEAAQPTGIAVPADAGLSVLVGTVNGMLGQQDDLVASMAPLIALPDGIATPIDTSVQSLRITLRRDDASYEAEVAITSPAAPADLVVFYQATLAATDLTFESDDTTEADGLRVRTLSYRNEQSALPDATLTVEVIEPAGNDVGPGGRAAVLLTAVDSSPAGAVRAFTGWTAPEFPEIGDGDPLEATVIGTIENGRLELTLLTAFAFADTTPDELHERFVAALPVAGVALAPGTDPDGDPAGSGPVNSSPDNSSPVNSSLVLLDDIRRQVPDLSVTFAPGEAGGTVLTVAGSFR